MCIGALPPFDHPHVFIDMGAASEAICPIARRSIVTTRSLVQTSAFPPRRLGTTKLPEQLSIAQARRVALAAQGFANQDRSAPVNWRQMSRIIGNIHLLQIDSVNVLIRSHYLPLYSRLGPYPRDVLDDRAFGKKNRSFFECWAHEASLVPLDLHPLIRWRMARARDGRGTYGSMNRFGQEERAYLKTVLDFVTRHGPTAASELPDAGKSQGGWWGWSRGKMALETLFDQGLVTTATRSGFERLYDIPERVLPSEIFRTINTQRGRCVPRTGSAVRHRPRSRHRV